MVTSGDSAYAQQIACTWAACTLWLQNMCCKPQCLFVTYCIAETMFSNAWKPRSQYSKTISKWLTGGQPPSNESSYTSCPTKEPLHLSPQHQITHVSHFPSVEDPCRLRLCITYYISIWAPKMARPSPQQRFTIFLILGGGVDPKHT